MVRAPSACSALRAGRTSYRAFGSDCGVRQRYEEVPQTLSNPRFGSFEAENSTRTPRRSRSNSPSVACAQPCPPPTSSSAPAPRLVESPPSCGGGGQPPCPPGGGTVTRTITPANFLVRQARGIAPGEFDVVAAMRLGVTYVNVHTAQFPGGFPGVEVRGKIEDA
jgi:hypothetical protein